MYFVAVLLLLILVVHGVTSIWWVWYWVLYGFVKLNFKSNTFLEISNGFRLKSTVSELYSCITVSTDTTVCTSLTVEFFSKQVEEHREVDGTCSFLQHVLQLVVLHVEFPWRVQTDTINRRRGLWVKHTPVLQYNLHQSPQRKTSVVWVFTTSVSN